MRRRNFALILVISLALQAAVLAETEYEDDEVDETHVKVLTDADFEETIASQEYVLVEFYAPWCGHCKALKPEYADAAAELAEADIPVTLAKVDATVHRISAAKHEVTGYPALKWFHSGKAQPYSGGRQSADIVQWVTKKTGPPALLLNDASELRKAAASKPVYLLGYFSQLEGSEYEAFASLARDADDVDFFETTSAEAAKAANITARPPSFVMGTAFEGFQPRSTPSVGHPAFQTDASLDQQLVAFLLAEKLPPYIEFSQAAQKQIFGSGIKHQVVVIAEADYFAPQSATMAAMEQAHAQFKGRIVLVTSTLGGETSQPIINYFGADGGRKDPQVFGMAGQRRYAMQEPFSAKSLQDFCRGVVEGTLEPSLRSEEAPANDLDGGVRVVVGKTFDRLVKDPEKDMFLEVYSPNCGHCKALAPTWKKLARQLRKVSTVEVAKMDGTTNEHLDLQIQGFPHLVLFPAGPDAQPVPYDGDRSLKDLRQFLKKHAAIPFSLPKKGGSSASDEASAEL